MRFAATSATTGIVIERGVEPDVTAVACARCTRARIVATLSFVVPELHRRFTESDAAQCGPPATTGLMPRKASRQLTFTVGLADTFMITFDKRFRVYPTARSPSTNSAH